MWCIDAAHLQRLCPASAATWRWFRSGAELDDARAADGSGGRYAFRNHAVHQHGDGVCNARVRVVLGWRLDHPNKAWCKWAMVKKAKVENTEVKVSQRALAVAPGPLNDRVARWDASVRRGIAFVLHDQYRQLGQILVQTCFPVQYLGEGTRWRLIEYDYGALGFAIVIAREIVKPFLKARFSASKHNTNTKQKKTRYQQRNS
jgi:hypothetical protein